MTRAASRGTTLCRRCFAGVCCSLGLLAVGVAWGLVGACQLQTGSGDRTVASSRAAAGSTDVVVTVNAGSPGTAIPSDFAGLSFETGSERDNNAGVNGYFFDTHNTQALTLFQQSGVRNLRLGGGSVDNTVVPGTVNGSLDFTGIDKLFAFARAAHAKVIYSLRLLNGDASRDAAIAAHVWGLYANQIESFSIGNEPDWRSYHYPPAGTGPDPQIVYYKTSVAHQGYIQKWREFATTISAAVPGALFNGPDTGSNWPIANVSPPYAPSINTNWNGVTWTTNFAKDIGAWSFPNSSSLAYVTQHNYPGQGVKWRDASGVQHTLTKQQMINGMLSPTWDSRDYPALNGVSGAPALPSGVRYRLTESNPFSGALQGGSNCFGTALWALDYLHWWAQHGSLGVNFHNKQWGANNVIYYDGTNYTLYPIGYAIKAWDLGGHGDIEPTRLSNPKGFNLTAYAVGAANDLYVTIVNKEHGTGAHNASVAVAPKEFPAASAAALVLTDGKRGDASLLNATVGGARILNHGRWPGRWEPLSPQSAGTYTLSVAATSAVVVHLHAAGSFVGPIQINQQGALQLFGIDHLGRTWSTWQRAVAVPNSGASSWASWTQIGGPAASGPPAVTRNLDNTLAAFIAGKDGHVHYTSQSKPGGNFSTWTDLGGDGVALQAGAGADGSLYVFGIGSNGTLQYNSQVAADAGFVGWSGLGAVHIESGFVVARNLTGSLELFGVNNNGSVWHNWQTATGGWSGWTALVGATLDPHLAVARNLDGRVEIFGVDSGGHVWHDAQTSAGGSWNGWSPLTGGALKPGFVVGQDKNGRLVVLGVERAAPNDMLSAWQVQPGGAFATQWKDLGGPDLDPKLVVGNTADGRIQIFAMSGNGGIESNWQLSSGTWAGWSSLGNPHAVTFDPSAAGSPPPGADAGASGAAGATGAAGAGAAGAQAGTPGSRKAGSSSGCAVAPGTGSGSGLVVLFLFGLLTLAGWRRGGPCAPRPWGRHKCNAPNTPTA